MGNDEKTSKNDVKIKIPRQLYISKVLTELRAESYFEKKLIRLHGEAKITVECKRVSLS